MHRPNFLVYAIPFFLLLIAAELLLLRVQRRAFYRLNDTVSNLSAGIMSEVSALFTGGFYLWLYFLIYENYRLDKLLGVPALSPMAVGSAWGFAILAVVCFLLQDHQYYWWHRLSHQVNFMWAGHVIHHSSEELNLTVALRQSGTVFLANSLAYAPLAFLGFHPFLFMGCGQLNNIYQFFLHTRAVDKLPAWFEAVFNTPSHHRVHHGRNPEYIDRNHAGTLIIWDRLYGTFAPEVRPVVYGITEPLGTWNPLWGQVHYYVRLWRLARRAPRWRDKLLVWFKPPGWLPQGLGPRPPVPAVSADSYVKFGAALPAGLGGYVLCQFLAVVALNLYLTIHHGGLAAAQTLALALAVAGTLGALGLLLDLRRSGYLLEVIRLSGLGGAGVWLAWSGGALPAGAALLAGALLSLWWLRRYRALAGGGLADSFADAQACARPVPVIDDRAPSALA